MKCVHVGICLKEETLENIFPLPLFPLNKMLARQAETDTKLQNKGFHNDEYKMKGFCFGTITNTTMYSFRYLNLPHWMLRMVGHTPLHSGHICNRTYSSL